MHPAPSVIIFTAISGLGFGMLFFLGLGWPLNTGWTAFWFFFIAYALAVGGLISSTFHLGHPERAWKAFSQWRTSWLSREGVLSVAALCVMGLYAIGLIFFATHIAWLGWIGAALCVATSVATGMIYGQMKTVPRWHQPLTPVLFVAYTLAGGALLTPYVEMAALLVVVLIVLQALHWVLGDRAFAKAGSDIGTATGLAPLGQTRLLESPHSGTNYLLREMAFQIGRKHARRLRIITGLGIGLVPLVLLVFLPPSHMASGLAVLMHVIGLFAARWLFFAEAEHVVGLYYDKHKPE